MPFTSVEEVQERIRSLYRQHHSRTEIQALLVEEGLTEDQATDALDGEPIVLRRPGEPPPLPGPALSGIGGWLVLPAIGLVLGPLRMAKGLYDLRDLVAPDALERLEALHEGFAALVRAEFWISLGLLAWLLVAAVLFFLKKRAAPRVLIGFLAAQALWAIADTVWADLVLSEVQVSPAELVGPLVGAAVWIPYFATSTRVRNTFVN